MAQIKKDTSLRKAILQAAITGQLISNVEGESLPLAPASKLSSATPSAGASPATPPETGKQLLDRIIEERNKKLIAEWEEALKKNPKAKKPAPVVASEIEEEEIPFEIPENWCWCRLGDICLVKGGKRIPAGCTLTDIDTGHKYIRVADMKNGSVIVNNVKYITDEIHEKIKAYKISKDDVYITVAGTIGDSGIIPDELDNANLTENADKLVLFNGINKYCLHFFLSSGFFQEQISDAITKVGQPKLAIIRIQNFLLPLPPLAVQNAIVAKLEQVLPLVDAYENALLQKEELKSELPDKVKKAILQEAITGQLTETWRKSATIKENGKQLLDRIIEERNAKAFAEWEEALKKNPKAKKPVSVVASEIEEDEIPFEVPESWCWCRLGDLVPFGQCENAEPNEIEDEAWILDLEDIEKDSGRILQFKTKKEVDSKSTKHIFKKGYVLYSKLRPYLNKCVIAPQDGYCTSEILPLDFGKLINNKYAQTFLMSPYFVDYTDSLSFGVKMPRLGTEDGKKALVPLPPLEEQEEIVKKVEELLPLCK